MVDARVMLDEVNLIDYNSLRATGAKHKGSAVELEAGRPMASHLKGDMIKNRREGGDEDHENDIFDGKDAEEVDKIILNELQ